MKSVARYLLALCLLILAAQPLFAMAEREAKVNDIKNNPGLFNNERVRIEGFVTQYVESGSTTTAFFYFKDDYGGIIRVRTSRQAPHVGRRYAIVGPVGYDPVTKNPYVSEEVRTPLNPVPTTGPFPDVVVADNVPDQPITAAPAAPVPSVRKAPIQTQTQTQTATPTVTKKGRSNLLLLGGGVLLLLIIGGLAFELRRSFKGGAKPASMDLSLAAAAATPTAPAPVPEQIVEGRTIKMHAPPPNTVKMMPGFFEVVAGDETVKQVRFYKLRGDTSAETTFGRSTGRPYAHIQLKPMTVSQRQAKVAFDPLGTPKITNFAPSSSNPTKVNGRELAAEETMILQDGDRVEMGEIQFRFHAS